MVVVFLRLDGQLLVARLPIILSLPGAKEIALPKWPLHVSRKAANFIGLARNKACLGNLGKGKPDAIVRAARFQQAW
jgi:hypothetical protein